MRNFIKILLGNQNGKYISCLEEELISNFPLTYALELAKQKIAPYQPEGWLGEIRYLSSDFEKDSGHVYIFHCYTKEEKSCDLSIKNNFDNYLIYEKYKNRIPQTTKTLQDKVSLDDLIYQMVIPEGFSPENIRKNGFYKHESTIPTGCFNFQESIKFMGINIYEKDKPRGNHYHYLKVEYTYVLSGQIEAEIEMIEHKLHKAEIRKIILNPGDLILFLPGFNHKLTATTSSAMAIEVCPQRFNHDDIYHL